MQSPESIDLNHLRQWVGRQHTSTDTLSLRHARLMAVTLGQNPESLQTQDPLPPLWHWLYFLEGLPPEQLGLDGHPARGGFLPPVPLANRMWAGGRLAFFTPLRLDEAAEKHSQVLSVEHKSGRSGDLVFVTVEHEIWQGGVRALREEHDIVYKNPTRSQSQKPINVSPYPEPGQWHRQCRPDTTLLFRYSALTFNGHRIHYDQDHCRQVEGYENLVIHGPLNATLLAGLAQDVLQGLTKTSGDHNDHGPAQRQLRHFVYRGLQAATLGTTLHYNANAEKDRLSLWVHRDDGVVSMQAEARWD
jgi:3-methylfumaryl-CoA hydratase